MAKRTENARTQRQRVTDAIQNGILEGKFNPGDPLRQIPLSAKFGVSQSVVRESLRTLEQSGLVEGAENLGFVVRSFGTQELVDAYRVREVLEGLAARSCCRKASQEDVDHLRAIAGEIHARSGRRARARRSELEYQFHRYFLELSENQTLQRVSVGYRFVGNFVVTERDPDELLEEHLAIVEAVAANEPDEAERLARLHVRRSAESIQDRNATKSSLR